ncbi:MAG: PQQ-binding-like beta-propeller repeat protein [Verrucomicrobiae bacterium]|nr:PQQ-binding-like beta-propeller repeat protein [Verrucomicrobiae bacterium]
MKAPCFAVVTAAALTCWWPVQAEESVQNLLQKIDVSRGILCVAGYTDSSVLEMARASELQILALASRDQYQALGEAAEAAGLLGSRVFVSVVREGRIPLAENVADAVLVGEGAMAEVSQAEIERVLHPRASAWKGGERWFTKAVPDGYDEWTHPFHGPDNNPQSQDRFAVGSMRTQFIAEPKFSPMPEQTVIGGGRIYKAMGHIAHKANQNENLNTLLCINAWNGTILWKRPLPEGFMIHRNTMIATENALYLGDDQSCKEIDGATGEVRREITVPAELTDGPVWKWMAIRDGILYGLVGNPEVKVDTMKSVRRGLGHWPWDMWKGHDYIDPNLAFGFGRTLVAIDLESGALLWNHRDREFLDARAMALNDLGQLIGYAPEKFLTAFDAKTGASLWKNSSEPLLAALGPNARAQHYMTGYATTAYLKCRGDRIFFAGPQREQMVVASAEDGRLLWTHEVGNLQLVLREDAVWAAGPQNTFGRKLAYDTGSVLEEFPARRACTRATGSVDSIFYRASGGTVRVFTETNTANHIDPMRPPCQDGVLISNGQLYWGPWMCGCQLSLYGNLALAPQSISGDVGEIPDPESVFASALEKPEAKRKTEFAIHANDWPQYRGDAARRNTTAIPFPDAVSLAWKQAVSFGEELPTAPVAAGGLVFVANRAGVVEGLAADSGESVWKNYTTGPVFYPPVVEEEGVFVGSADGRVYALDPMSGDEIWNFRVGPRDQLIPVFGKLISSWPLSGGVVAKDGTIYAAGGITHYDGTWVVALDAKTGEVKAHNATSGTVASEVDNGISMQGNLRIVDGELRFLGGGVYEWARYDLKTLANLNDPKVQVNAEFRTAFYPYYPEYGKYLSLSHTCDNGCVLNHDANYEGLYFNNLSLQRPLSADAIPVQKDAAGEFIRMKGRRRGEDTVPTKPEIVWEDQKQRRFTAFIVSEKGDRLLVAGHPEEKESEPFLALMNTEDGRDVWFEKLPAQVVKGGAAIDADGRIFVTLENGELRCYASAADGLAANGAADER